MPRLGLGLGLGGRPGGGGVPALYQWALDFFYGQNSQYIVLGVI